MSTYISISQASFLGICDKNQLRIYQRGNKGLFTEDGIVFHDYWENLQKPEIFNALKKLIGRDVIAKMK